MFQYFFQDIASKFFIYMATYSISLQFEKHTRFAMPDAISCALTTLYKKENLLDGQV